ncbi:MAG: Rieske (2Fe-2S) protein [Candidatus Saccharibacteria bacterium]
MTREYVGESGDFAEGEMKGLTVGSKYLLVARVEGKLHAMDGRCSHMTSDLSKGMLEGHLITCRLHGAQFDIRTGERLRNMAARPMNAYSVEEEGGKVFVDLP